MHDRIVLYTYAEAHTNTQTNTHTHLSFEGAANFTEQSLLLQRMSGQLVGGVGEAAGDSVVAHHQDQEAVRHYLVICE